MRYYLLREMPLGNDGDFTFESLFGRFNAELANDLGNLINRSLTLIAKLSAQAAPARDDALYRAGENPYWQLEVQATEACGHAAAAMAWPVPEQGRVLSLAPATLTASAPSPLFPRLDDKLQQAILDKIVPPDVAAAAAAPAAATPAGAAEPRSAPLAPIKID